MKLTETKLKAPAPLFTVAWVPALEVKPETSKTAITAGGRIIETHLSKLGAEQIERCLNIGTEGLEGEYITI